MKSYWMLFCLTVLASCSSGGTSDSDNIEPIDSRFVGLWDQTSAIEDLEDVYYHFIGNDGIAYDYDYLGDSFDDIENCYVKVDDRQQYEREGSNYRITLGPNDAPDLYLLVELDVVSNELQATSLETIEGEVVKGQVIELGTRLTGISITDIENQLCSEF